MDGSRFDALVRALLGDGSRRGLLAGVTGGLVALGTSGLGADDALARKRNRRRRKKCKGGKTKCDGKCVNVDTDPLNCGGCGQRCQLNATCTDGQCACVVPACPDFQFGFTCCPQGNPVSCSCGLSDPGSLFTDPLTCDDIPAAECPEAQRCIGPTCQACCPVGATCDTTTGTCLQGS